ncbi:MAG TPA: hypothetical protein HA306_05795 [Methanosarcina sp.]|nr:hypothetical protein [Methanosarcina sp.]
MVKFAHLLVVSVLVTWLAVSGCVEDTADQDKAGIVSDISGMEDSGNTSTEELTEADIQEFEENITHLEDLLENSSEEIIVEDIQG